MVRKLSLFISLMATFLLMVVIPFFGQWLAVTGPDWVQAGWTAGREIGNGINDVRVNGLILAVVIGIELLLIVIFVTVISYF